MKNTTFGLFALAGLAFAAPLSGGAGTTVATQASSATYPFLAALSSANVSPAPAASATGFAVIVIHALKNADGTIASGSIDFKVSCAFPGATSVVGLHIHSGAAGTAGGIVVPTTVGTPPVVVDSTGKSAIQQQVQTGTTIAGTLLADIIAHPRNYYVNVHTVESPGGAMRGQLAAAKLAVRMGLLTPQAEGTSSAAGASGVATLLAWSAMDASTSKTIGYVSFNANYTGFAAGTTFAGMHVHPGAAGVNGPVAIDSGLVAPLAANSNGTGALRYEAALAPGDAGYTNEIAALNGLFDNPNGYYLNIHTTSDPGGAIRGQMRLTDVSSFPIAMAPVPPPASPATGPSGLAAIAIYTLRNADASVAAATVVFDVNFSNIGMAATVVGLHIHQGAAGTSGAVVIPTGLSASNSILSATGAGNTYHAVTVSDTAGLAALNQLVQTPSGFYVNLHTLTNPGGLIRSQLASAVTAAPVIKATVGAADFKGTASAPGGIVSIFGTNLAQNANDLSGLYKIAALPNALNGVSVTVGGTPAPLYYVGPGQINAQVPFSAAAGMQPVIVTAPNGASMAANLTIASAAPGIFVVDFTSGIGAIIKNSDFSLVTARNPAHAGDVLLIFSTGGGQTTPPLATGSLLATPGIFNNTAAATVNFGSQAVTPIYSIAAPGFAGLYQTAVTVPAGVASGGTVSVGIGTAVSNAVNLPVQ